MGKRPDTELARFGGTPETVVKRYTLKDKPSLLSLADLNLGDVNNLQEWLAAFAMALHDTGWAQGPEQQEAGKRMSQASNRKHELGTVP